jgi:uncharacterized protein (DUF4415 family)
MRKYIDITQDPTPEQIAMLKKAATFPLQDDAEYPEFSEAELLEFKKVSAERKPERQKQTVTLRLSPQALRNAKSLGKGYTSVLSRILEDALTDPDTIHHHL